MGHDFHVGLTTYFEVDSSNIMGHIAGLQVLIQGQRKIAYLCASADLIVLPRCEWRGASNEARDVVCGFSRRSYELLEAMIFIGYACNNQGNLTAYRARNSSKIILVEEEAFGKTSTADYIHSTIY